MLCFPPPEGQSKFLSITKNKLLYNIEKFCAYLLMHKAEDIQTKTCTHTYFLLSSDESCVLQEGACICAPLCAGRGGDLWDFQHWGGSVFREQALPVQPTDLDKETAAPQMHYKLRKV